MGVERGQGWRLALANETNGTHSLAAYLFRDANRGEDMHGVNVERRSIIKDGPELVRHHSHPTQHRNPT